MMETFKKGKFLKVKVALHHFTLFEDWETTEDREDWSFAK